MKLTNPVSEIMTAEPIYAEKDNTFSQARDLFMKFNLHHLPVVENGAIIGIISTNDIAAAYTAAGKKDLKCGDEAMNKEFPLDSVMTKDPVHISPSTSIEQAIKVFQNHSFQALPVVDLGKLKGIVTLKDIVAHIMD